MWYNSASIFSTARTLGHSTTGSECFGPTPALRLSARRERGWVWKQEEQEKKDIFALCANSGAWISNPYSVCGQVGGQTEGRLGSVTRERRGGKRGWRGKGGGALSELPPSPANSHLLPLSRPGLSLHNGILTNSKTSAFATAHFLLSLKCTFQSMRAKHFFA